MVIAGSGPIHHGFVDICVGDRHSCALTDDGGVQCWGSGEQGELGQPLLSQSSLPVVVPGLSGAVQVRCASSLTCVRTQAGQVWCWGDDSRRPPRPQPGFYPPTEVPALRGASDLWVAHGGVCAVSDGMLRCDGLRLAGSESLTDAQRFVLLPPALPAVCVLRRDGPPTCLRAEPGRRAGDRVDPPLAIKTRLTQPPDKGGATRSESASPAAAVSQAGLAALAPQLAGLKPPPGLTDLAIWGGQPCYLSASAVQCGEPLQPVVAATLAGARPRRVLAVGSDVLCLQTDRGQARCATWMSSPLAAPAAALASVRALAVAEHHACAVLADGTASCWGEASHGQLGDGTRYQQARPQRVFDGAVELAVSEDLSCARRRDGSLWCWGVISHCDRDERCQRRSEPTRIPTPAPSLAVALSSLLSTRRLCSQDARGWACLWGDWLRVPSVGKPLLSLRGGLLTSDGWTYDWAPSNPPSRPVPHFFRQAGVRVQALSPDGTCAIASSGAVVCGHCGVCSASEARTILTTLPVPSGARALSPFVDDGAAHGICILTAAGRIECTDLGQAPWQRAEQPRPMLRETLGGLREIQAMAWGQHPLRRDGAFACVLGQDGGVQCWGDNADGQLGDGSRQRREQPVVVPGLPPVQALGAGSNHACALTRAGEVYCWGSARRGATGSSLPLQRLTPVQVSGP